MSTNRAQNEQDGYARPRPEQAACPACGRIASTPDPDQPDVNVVGTPGTRGWVIHCNPKEGGCGELFAEEETESRRALAGDGGEEKGRSTRRSKKAREIAEAPQLFGVGGHRDEG